VIQRLTYFVSFWFVGRASTQEEFDAMLREQGLEEQDLDAEEELPAMEAAEEIRDIVLESVVSEEKPKEEEPEVKPKKSKKTKKKAPVKKEPKSDDNPEEPAEKQETE